MISLYFSDCCNDDTNTMSHIFHTNEESILNWLEPEDTFVVDRSFRDILSYIRSLSFTVYMPPFLSKSPKSYTTTEANRNRFITKIRWIVKSVNGRVKQFEVFDRVIPNSSLSCIHNHLWIVGAIINAYRPELIRYTSYDDEIARVMLESENKTNVLETSVDDNKFQKIKKCIKMEGIKAAPDIPKLWQAQLEKLTLGIFQLKQEKSYANEHINDDGCYEIITSTQTNNLLRTKIYSRHFNGKAYNAFIQNNKHTVLE